MYFYSRITKICSKKKKIVLMDYLHIKSVSHESCSTTRDNIIWKSAIGFHARGPRFNSLYFQ